MLEGVKMKIKMSIAEIMNTIIKRNINVGKVVEASHKIKVNKEEIAEPPMTESTPTFLSSMSNWFEVLYSPLYDTTYLLPEPDSTLKMFVKPLGQSKSHVSTNMLESGRLAIPTMFVVKGFSMITDIPKEKLNELIMTFVVISKEYARMPLSHLPFEYPDNRIIIPSMGYFGVEIRNESLEKTERIRGKLVLFINGWELRAIQ